MNVAAMQRASDANAGALEQLCDAFFAEDGSGEQLRAELEDIPAIYVFWTLVSVDWCRNATAAQAAAIVARIRDSGEIAEVPPQSRLECFFVLPDDAARILYTVHSPAAELASAHGGEHLEFDFRDHPRMLSKRVYDVLRARLGWRAFKPVRWNDH